MKLLEEEKKEKREEEERKERKRTKEREKKHRRKERQKGKEREKEKYCSVSSITSVALDVSNEESSRSIEVEENVAINCKDSVGDTDDIIVSKPDSTNVEGEQFLNGHSPSSLQNQIFDGPDGDGMEVKDGNGPYTERSKFSRHQLKFRKDGQFDPSLKRCARRQFAVVSESSPVHRSEPRFQGENFEAPSRSINGLSRQLKISSARSNGQLCGVKCTEKFQCSTARVTDMIATLAVALNTMSIEPRWRHMFLQLE